MKSPTKSPLEEALERSRVFDASAHPEAQPLPPAVEVLQPTASVERAEGSRIPTQQVQCSCGEVLVHIAPGGAAILHVYERTVLRPHALEEGDLPLVWRCNHCQQETTIGA